MLSLSGLLHARHLSWSTVPRAALLLCFAGIVFGPLAAMVLNLPAASATAGSAWQLMLPSGRRLALLAQSVGLALAVAAGGVLLGQLAALHLWQKRSGFAGYARWLLLATALIPPYIHALAWTSSAYYLGSLFEALGLARVALEGWTGSWWVEVMAYAPLSTGLCLMGLELIDPALVEAARVSRSDSFALVRIILPLAAPAILAAGGLLFVLSLADYSVPSLFSSTVYSLEIFSEFSAGHNAMRSLFLSLPLLLTTAAVTVLCQSVLRNTASCPPRGRRSGTPLVWPSWFEGWQRAALLVLIAQACVPAISLLAATGSWASLVDTVALASREISFTTWIALSTALGCLPLAFSAAAELLRRDWRGRLWWLMVTLPLAIPAPLTGIGIIALCNRPALQGIYGSDWMPVLAALARFTPLAALLALVQLRRVDPLLMEAARVHQRNPVHGWLQVRMPLVAPGIIASAGITFALAVGELGATILVAPPGRATLAMRIYNYLHYGASSAVAGLCLVMAFSVGVAACIVLASLAAWYRLSTHSPS